MRTKFFTLSFVLIAVCFVAALAQTKPNQMNKSESANGWKSLFDGKTLTGWRGFHSQSLPAGWAVEDGCIKKVGS